MQFDKGKACICRGCHEEIPKGDLRFSTYTTMNRGTYIFFCLDCIDLIVEMKEVVLKKE